MFPVLCTDISILLFTVGKVELPIPHPLYENKGDLKKEEARDRAQTVELKNLKCHLGFYLVLSWLMKAESQDEIFSNISNESKRTIQ